MTPASQIDTALAHAERGRRVFPYHRVPQTDGTFQKIPAIKWKDGASAEAEQVQKLWRGKSRLPAGWALPEGTVVVDIDDPDAYDHERYPLPETASQRTQRGTHHLYRTDGRSIPQATKVVPGADTRVGGKSFVALYGPESFEGDVADAPEWLYSLARPSGNPATEEPISSRSEILSLAGRLRWAGLSGDEINDVLIGRLEDGRIYAADETDPWGEDDLARIAKDYGQKPVGVFSDYAEPMTITRVKRNGHAPFRVTGGPRR